MKTSDLVFELSTQYAELQRLYENIWEEGETANEAGHTRRQLWLEDIAHTIALAQGHITNAIGQAIKGESK